MLPDSSLSLVPTQTHTHSTPFDIPVYERNSICELDEWERREFFYANNGNVSLESSYSVFLDEIIVQPTTHQDHMFHTIGRKGIW